jgi:hypothetical protein
MPSVSPPGRHAAAVEGAAPVRRVVCPANLETFMREHAVSAPRQRAQQSFARSSSLPGTAARKPAGVPRSRNSSPRRVA